MERVLQYLDDLEDLYYAIALLSERSRQAVRFFLFITTALLAQSLGVALALISPPLAVAAASLLMVGMLYRGVVQGISLSPSVS
jgi:hypothetical protein